MKVSLATGITCYRSTGVIQDNQIFKNYAEAIDTLVIIDPGIYCS